MFFYSVLPVLVALFENSILTYAWLPTSGKIRGVNLGSQFIVEPWMASDEWSSMGCGSFKSEFDCVSHLGQSQANQAWAKHWNTWTTQADITEMKSYGLNTIRIPVGYWIREDIVYSNSEHFPQGGLHYLEQICGWASDAGIYIIIDLHGAPGAQIANNPDTGQYASSSGFYIPYQYERAYQFLEWMTNIIHTNPNYRGVGMLEILNEPETGDNSATSSLRSQYYPTAIERIRAAEAELHVPAQKSLHIQMMNQNWGSGDPTQYLSSNDTSNIAFDSHRYLKYDPSLGASPSPSDYLQASCSDNRSGGITTSTTPTIVGEWSLSPKPENQAEFLPTQGNEAWYRQWFEAQVQAYERLDGWIFWSWRAGLGDWRWSYKDAIAAGVISKNLDDVARSDPCGRGS